MRTFYLALCLIGLYVADCVEYSGHKVLTVVPKTDDHVQKLQKLREDYSIDLWNEPKYAGQSVMVRLQPGMIKPIEKYLKDYGIDFDVAFADLQSVIAAEKIAHSSPANGSRAAASFDFSRYNQYENVVQLLKDLTSQYSNIAKLETIGSSYENRPIYSIKISSGESSTKPVIIIECGIHAREWSSVATCSYFINKLITTYGSDPEVTSLVDKYEFNIINEANPDGYVYTWNHDRLWRKTRSQSSFDWQGVCKGADANRNFDVEHCGAGTSRKPCDEIFCGDKPFSESEARAIRDLIIAKKDRISIYFTVHAFSQFWMTPYGTTKKLPDNYDELSRIGRAGVSALSRKYGTHYRLGSIANIIYEAAGSSLDYAVVKQGVKIGFALELRDTGRFGFFLPQQFILPTCEETYDGIIAAIQAL